MRPIIVPEYITKHLKDPEWFLQHAGDIKQKIDSLNAAEPDVSIVIPAYNEQENILRALSSIASTVSNYKIEVIVVDNNSTDRTKELVLLSGARYLFEQKRGVKNARNRGLNAAKGRYIINADADTVYSPHWVNSLIDPLESNSNIAVTHGKFAFIPENGYGRVGFYLYEMIGDVYKKAQGIMKDKAMYVYGCSSAYRKEQGLLVDGYEHPPGANEDGYLGLKLRNKFGSMKRVSAGKSYAWTSGRNFVAEGTLLNRLFGKVKQITLSHNATG